MYFRRKMIMVKIKMLLYRLQAVVKQTRIIPNEKLVLSMPRIEDIIWEKVLVFFSC